MSDVALQVERLGKAYRIGMRDEAEDTLLRSVLSWARAPARNWKRLRRLTSFAGDESAEDVLWALRDVSFDLSAGEILGVVGRNGAGKTTLLKILSRITEPTEGRAIVRGRVSSLLEVGTGFHPELTGRENVYMNGTILGMRKREIDARFDQIVDFSGVSRFIDTPVKRYSSGMRVRLAFAVAAHLEPEILVIDEVLAVGDASFQSRCLGKMGEVARGGRTVLFVSHNMSAVASLCTSCLLLVDGRLETRGAVPEVIGRYLGGVQEARYDVDLREAKKRVVGASPLIYRWRVTDEEGRTLSHVLIGQDVTFRVLIHPARPIEDVHLGIRILGARGERLVTPHTRFQVGEGRRVDGATEFTCKMRGVRLLPGRYSVELDLTSHGHPLEYVDSGLVLEIMPDDLYGTGKLPPLRTGYLAPDCTWEFNVTDG